MAIARKSAAVPAAPSPIPAAGPPLRKPAKKVAAVTKSAVARPAQPVVLVDNAAAARPPKPKLVRDSFTIPRAEYAVLDALKQRLIQLARPAKKSEVLRAGIKLLATLPDAALQDALAAVPEIKTGRPKKAK